MLMLTYIEREFAKSGKKLETAPILWVLDGRAFAIRDKTELVKQWLPLFFRQTTKFTSFTRKLYRWGFRQVNMPLTDSSQHKSGDTLFGNEDFQRDNKGLLSRMRSVTAAGIRREHAMKAAVGSKRGRAAELLQQSQGFSPGLNYNVLGLLGNHQVPGALPLMSQLTSTNPSLSALGLLRQQQSVQQKHQQQQPGSIMDLLANAQLQSSQLASIQPPTALQQPPQDNAVATLLGLARHPADGSLLAPHLTGSMSESQKLQQQQAQSGVSQERLREVINVFLKSNGSPA